MTENPTDDKEISSSENEGVELDSDEEVKKNQFHGIKKKIREIDISQFFVGIIC